MGGLDGEIEGFGEATGMDLKDLSKDDFVQVLNAWMDLGCYFVLIAKTGKGEVPVGVIAENRKPTMIEPHVVWFPWASDRNKLETIMKFVNEMRREVLVVIFAEYKERRFWNLLSNYGIIKRRTATGGIKGWYGDDACEIWVGA